MKQGPLFIFENPTSADDENISLLKNVVLEPEATTVSRVPNTTSSSASMCGVVAPTNKAIYKICKKAPKRPPRPPNAFILYRREKQSEIMAKFPGYINNEVSKESGRMWSEEPQEARFRFQQMADAAKQEHMKKYPDYKYRPRKPRRRSQKPKDSSSNRVSTKPKDSSSNWVSTNYSLNDSPQLSEDLNLEVVNFVDTSAVDPTSIDFNYQPIFVDCPLISSPLSYWNLNYYPDSLNYPDSNSNYFFFTSSYDDSMVDFNLFQDKNSQ
ncbi:8947_t:CDS:2 [Cetraspora pellucida]|uniref:8947_t:CDS:1 n=1 Tax=Cetraspora pellucida TaxID=1433469 RepID=A0A9N9A9G4_9GLOM|nr:8947_t:CDS:2 [Cetraspora pellucida]